jgi:uncharacterized membrane protein YbhN (UPF0104 family)
MSAALKSLVKYGVALVLLALVIRHAGIGAIAGDLRRITLFSWIAAIACVTLAQLISSFRMEYFFRAAGYPLSARYAIILCYIGAFYNFLLPGGIGGDAYKVILARKRMEMGAKTGVRIMLADRGSGLCILLMLFAGLLLGMNITFIPYAHAIIVAGAIVTFLCYLGFSQALLAFPPRVMAASLGYSLVIQLLWMGALASVWLSLGDGQHLEGYLALYCAASIAGMIPASPGGLGLKEGTYYFGATWLAHYAGLPLSPQLGVTLSLCLFVLMFISALPGVIWLEKIGKMDYSKSPQ